MSLVYGSNVPKLQLGYQTEVNNKGVKGGVIAGNAAVQYGSVVAYGNETGFYTAVANQTSVGAIAGFALGTLISVPANYPAENLNSYQPGSAFNLMVKGSIAVEIANIEGATNVSNIVEGADLYVYLTNGALTTYVNTADTKFANYAKLEGAKFTGIYEDQGTNTVAWDSTNSKFVTTHTPKYVAEIEYNL